MPRASARFSLAAGAFGQNNNSGMAGLPSGRESARSTTDELHVENERLKTTLTILTQKLKVKEDDTLQ